MATRREVVTAKYRQDMFRVFVKKAEQLFFKDADDETLDQVAADLREDVLKVRRGRGVQRK